MAIEDVLRGLDNIVDNIENKVEIAIYECSADLLRESNMVCPIDSSDLRKSGKLKVEKESREIVGTVSYGDARATYAEVVHEVRSENYSEGGTGWKYLENPLKEKSNLYQAKIKNAVEEVIR